MQRSDWSRPLTITAFSFALLASLGASRVHAQEAAPSSTDKDQKAHVLLDTLAARMGTLEIERATLIASGRSAQHADLIAVDSQLAALRQYLHEIPDAKVSQAYATKRELSIIDGGLAHLAVERRVLSASRPNHPDVQAIAAAEKVLERRRSELQAFLVGAVLTP